MTPISWICLIFTIVSCIGLARAAEDPTAPPAETAEVTYAQTLSVCWEHATHYVNGDPLPLSEIADYEVEVQHPDGLDSFSAGVDLKYEFLIRKKGNHCVRVRTLATNQLYSAWTEQICKDVQYAPRRIKLRFCDE